MAKLTKIPKQPCNEDWFDMNTIYDNREGLTLREYQTNHLGFFLNRDRSMDLSEAGTGKTPAACLWIYERSQDGQVVWTMPKSLLVKNWQELLLWSNLEPHEVMLIDGTKSQRDKQFANPTTKVFLMGFDAFANNWQTMIEKFPKLYHLCGDEWHLGFSTHGEPSYRDPNKFFGPKRTHSMYQFMKRGGNWLGMTGTLISGRLNSAYPAIKLIDPLVYPSYDNFMLWHAMLDEWGKPFMWKNHGRLQMLLDKHSKRVTFEQAYGKEKKIIVAEMCTMSTTQYKAYKEIRDRGITELENDVLEAEGEAVALQRCLAIMQTPERFGLKHNDTDGKDARILQHLETHKFTGKPLIIFDKVVQAHERYRKLCEKVGLRAEVINGSVTKNRGQLDYEFREGRIDVMICSPEVAGVGFNWGHVDHMIFSLFDWQDTQFVQNYRRAMRGVRESNLRITLLAYRGGMELKMARKLLSKSMDRTQVEEGVTVDLVTPIQQAA